MTIEELRAFLAECARQMTELANGLPAERSAFDDAEQTRWDQLDAWATDAEAQIARHERIGALAGVAGSTTPGSAQPFTAPNQNRSNDPFDVSELRFGTPGAEFRSRALRAIEDVDGLEDRHREATEALIRRDPTGGAVARHVLATGSEAYRTAWQKMVSGNGHMLEQAERQAMDVARAMSLTDANGGFAVPFTLDPTIISTRSVTTNPFRKISTVKTTVTDQWQGVTSGGMTVSWDGEGAQVSDDSPVLDDVPIKVHKAQGFAVGSIEISQDWVGIEGDLRAMFQEGKDDAEAIVFTTGAGDGSNQPTGIITALAGGASIVTPTTAETFAAADIYKVEEALPGKYRLATLDGEVTASRASWIANRSVYNRARQFDTAGGAQLWERIGAGLPPELAGYRVYEASAMDGAWNVAQTADNLILGLGDFRYYVIVDRVGLSVEFIPHIFGANGRPTGQRGWYCYWRVGADSVNDDAFRLLNLATTA
jgi:HK97 family phage major capsid protein